MLGVMVLVIVLSVMNGFGYQIRSKIIETNGHIRIEANGLMDNGNEVVRSVAEVPGVEAAAPYAQGLVMMQFAEIPSFPFIKGVDVEHEQSVIPLEKFLQEDAKVNDLDDDSVFVGTGLASRLGIRKGDYVEVYSPTMLDHMKKEEILLPKELLVAGIFDSGWNQIDSNTILVTLRTMQDFYNLGHSIHGVSVKLDSRVSENQLEGLAGAIAKKLGGGLNVFTWYEANRDFMFVLRLEKTMLFFIIIFIILVASFSIASSLMTSVVRKTKEIGILSALGATRFQVASCFCLQGLIIGSVGTFLGISFGLIALFFRNDIVHVFARLTHSEAALLKFYQFADIPVHYMMSDFVTIIGFAVFISTLAGLLPAWRAARLNPSEALRSE